MIGLLLQQLRRGLYWADVLMIAFPHALFSAYTLLYKATGDNFDALALQMIKGCFLLHAMEFPGTVSW